MLDPFDERFRRALDDDKLGRTLLRYQRTWRAARDREMDRLDFETMRSRLAAVKNEVIDNLPAYIDQFSHACEATGATMYHVSTPEQAVAVIVDIARSRGLQRVAKSKSMVSEEIDLTPGLQAAGFEVVETDLGEWIVQLAGERPSHIVGPALHKDRYQIAELLIKATGQAVDPENIEALVALARETLRDAFLGAEVGISGANVLVAETGTVVIASNEGNAELVTSLPRVHVVLAGIEKIVPGVEDAMAVLELLAPSATGQPGTNYTTFITGPTGPDQEMHVVLLDNGRSAMQASPLFRDALRCIRCGACSNICPAFGVVGGHVFGYIYSGAIGLVNTPFHHGIEHDAGPQSLCVSCNACQTVCPVDIPLPRQILDARAWSVRAEGMPVIKRLGLAVWSRPRLFGAAARAGALVQKPVQRGAFVEPPAIKRLIGWRKLPALAPRPLRDTWNVDPASPLPGEVGKRLDGITVAIFAQCLTDWILPELGRAVIEIMRMLGATVVFPPGQHCCGLPALDAGAPDRARHMARQTIRVLERCAADYVVSGATSCVVAVRHDYPHLFRDEPEWQARALAIGRTMFDLTTFLTEIAWLPSGLIATEGETATYHYFCQSYNVLGFRQQPLDLLSKVCGVRLTDLPEANVCCGFGGSVSFERPELSQRILERKLRNVEDAGASLLITDNPGCIMHLRGGIAARNAGPRVLHTAEIVRERLSVLR